MKEQQKNLKNQEETVTVEALGKIALGRPFYIDDVVKLLTAFGLIEPIRNKEGKLEGFKKV